MTITLRQVSKRADGGDIVRTHRIEGATASIGRALDSDIVLPDLAVRLTHARLTLTQTGAVVVESLQGGVFEKDGRELGRTELDPSAGDSIRIGDHRLTIEAGAAPGEVVVTAARIEPVGAVHPEAAGRIFALHPALLDKRRAAWTFVTLILLVALAWPVVSFFRAERVALQPDAQWSTGHLSAAHAFLETNCEACHQQAFVAVRDEACMDCHAMNRPTPELIQVAARVQAAGSPQPPLFVREHALHGRLTQAAPPPEDSIGRLRDALRSIVNRQDDRCASCHLEHQGPLPAADGSAPMIRPSAPTLRPINVCTDCHAGLSARLADTDLIDTPDWPRHPEFHPLVTLSAGDAPVRRRLSIADAPQENSGLIFPHDLHLSDVGGVARMAISLPGYGAPLTCANCHVPDDAGFAPLSMEQACEACHSLQIGPEYAELGELPHGRPAEVIAMIEGYYLNARAIPPVLSAPRQRPGAAPADERGELRGAALSAAPELAAGAIRTAFSDGGVCHDCHKVIPSDTEAETPPDAPFEIERVFLSDDFLTRGTFDHRTEGHRPTDPNGPQCADCHAAKTSGASADLLMPSISACASCHGPSERVQPVIARSSCASCHSFHAPAQPTPRRRDREVLALRTDP